MRVKKLVHVGISGIPFGRSASINRCKSLYSFLNHLGYSILSINNRAGDVNSEQKIIKQGYEEPINISTRHQLHINQVRLLVGDIILLLVELMRYF